VYESGVVRLWEVARFNLVVRCGVLLPHNLIKTCVCVCVCRSWSRLRWCGWCPASGMTTGTRGRAAGSSTLRPATWRTFPQHSSRNFRKCLENSKSVDTVLCWHYTVGQNNSVLPTKQHLIVSVTQCSVLACGTICQYLLELCHHWPPTIEGWRCGLSHLSCVY